ncbi:MAG: nucleoside deaminase [Spirobacillus cienkowskii]|jgi:tRNA(adenine34) deaminase|uniref:tRNA-specific adenosine deaminase n=2 Tax=Spirobacillus cienkowskii TaxID=495820 RepID=A0A369KPF6_9BACT|nr:MAG: nucleoside deaminase [Spirobacillus cienkowskii]
MTRCLDLARNAAAIGEVPVGAIIVDSNKNIITEAHNLRETNKTATAHAELIAIEKACQSRSQWRLQDCTLYVSLEPCFMCAGAIILARIPRVVFAASDPKAGAVGSLFNVLNDSRLNHRCEVIAGVCSEESSRLLKSFFQERRKKSGCSCGT